MWSEPDLRRKTDHCPAARTLPRGHFTTRTTTATARRLDKSVNGKSTLPWPVIWKDNDYAVTFVNGPDSIGKACGEFVTPFLIPISQQEALWQRKKEYPVHFGNVPSTPSLVEDTQKQNIVSSKASDAHAHGADMRLKPPAQPMTLDVSWLHLQWLPS